MPTNALLTAAESAHRCLTAGETASALRILGAVLDPEDTIELKRTGNAPMRFKGVLLADRTDAPNNDPTAGGQRWHRIRLYRYRDGYVIGIDYLPTWERKNGSKEPDHSSVFVCPDETSVVATLRDEYDPTEWVVGFPPGDRFRERQARELREIAGRYEVLVGDVLLDAGIAEDLPCRAKIPA